jgi:hypothetical protein
MSSGRRRLTTHLANIFAVDYLTLWGGFQDPFQALYPEKELERLEHAIVIPHRIKNCQATHRALRSKPDLRRAGF